MSTDPRPFVGYLAWRFWFKGEQYGDWVPYREHERRATDEVARAFARCHRRLLEPLSESVPAVPGFAPEPEPEGLMILSGSAAGASQEIWAGQRARWPFWPSDDDDAA